MIREQRIREQSEIFKVLKGKNPTNLEFYIPVILSFNSEGEIKTFLGREKLRGFTSRIPALKGTVEEVVLQ